MLPPVRRSGSGLLQIPRPGLLPSPYYAGLGRLGPSRVVLSTRQSSLSLRPAAALFLASSPGSHPTPENLLPRSSGGLRGRDSHPPVDWPLPGHDTIRTHPAYSTARRSHCPKWPIPGSRSLSRLFGGSSPSTARSRRPRAGQRPQCGRLRRQSGADSAASERRSGRHALT